MSKKKQKKNKRKKRKEIRIGTWNIRTMLEIGKMEEVAKEMMDYKIEVLALQEMRWKGEGRIDKNNYSLLYGGESKQGRNGTGFMLNKEMRKRVLEFKRVNGRISYIRLKNEIANITIVNVYAPTEDAQDSDKDEFYEKLEEICEKVRNHDTLMVMGDFNAKMGKEEYWRGTAWKETIHSTTNDNGRRMGNMATGLNMAVISTKFQHKPEHKMTWRIPGKRTGNQIDHILINKKRQKMIQDVRSHRGADVGSDHILVLAKIKLRLVQKKKKESKVKKWRIRELEESTDSYQSEMEKQLRSTPELTSIDNEWINIKNIIEKAAKKTLGKEEKQKKKEWFDNECREVLERKKKARLKYLETRLEKDHKVYQEKRKQATKMLKYKKKRWTDKILEDLEREGKNNAKLYKMIKNQNRKKPMAKIGNKEWINHFKQLLVHENQIERDTENDTESNQQEEKEQTEITEKELNEVIDQLKKGKAGGHDGIVNEMIKNGGKELKQRLYKLIKQVWEKEEMPEDWKKGVIIPILKKGDPTVCTNYRGITLLNVAYKILTTLLNKKLTEVVDRNIGEYQCGFRRGRSTVDAIHMVNQAIEKFQEQGSELHILFVDFKQAFDSIKRETLIEDMETLGVKGKIRRLVEMTMKGSKATINTEDGETSEFEFNGGVRQGDGLSTTLFNISIEAIIRKCNLKGTIMNKSVQIIAYADDIVILARDRRSLIEITLVIEKEARRKGLIINQEKTKYMNVKREKQEIQEKEIRIGKNKFETVENFKYLGVMMNRKNDRSIEIDHRIQTGHRAYYKYKNIMGSKSLSRKTKMRIYRTAIRPVVAYGAETMNLTKGEEEKLRIFERKIVRKIFGGIEIDGVFRRRNNLEIQSILKGEDIVKIIKLQRLRWYGHINRMEEEKVIKRVTKWKPGFRSTRGRPASRWEDQVLIDIKSLNVKNWRQKIQDRKAWRKILESAKENNMWN